MKRPELFLVAQEHSLGCAVACVASRCGISYAKALALFQRDDWAWTRGYFCFEVVQAFFRGGFSYQFEPFSVRKHERLLQREGSLVFVERSTFYPSGHYLLQTRKGWMNCWANFPNMVPVIPAFERKLSGSVEYVLYERSA